MNRRQAAPAGSALTASGHMLCAVCRHERHRHLRLGSGPCAAANRIVVVRDGVRQPDAIERCRCPQWEPEKELW